MTLPTEFPVRTDVEIDDQLMAGALRLTGLRTKRAVVEAALRALIEKRGRELLLEAAGNYPWEGDLDRMRGRPPRTSRDRRRQLGLD